MCVFYVTLNEVLQKALENGTYKEELPDDWPADKLENISKALSRGKKYPVLAVTTVTVIEEDSGEPTLKSLYHIPLDSNVLAWVPPMLFSYAGLEG